LDETGIEWEPAVKLINIYGETQYIHIPPITEKDIENNHTWYDKFVEDIYFSGHSGKKLYILMPSRKQNANGKTGRLTRIFSRDGINIQNSANDTKIKVVYVNDDATWNGNSWENIDPMTMTIVADSNYVGNLMFYTNADINWEPMNSDMETELQGTYITSGRFKIYDYNYVIGQLIAGKTLWFESNFEGRYIQFNAPESNIDTVSTNPKSSSSKAVSSSSKISSSSTIKSSSSSQKIVSSSSKQVSSSSKPKSSSSMDSISSSSFQNDKSSSSTKATSSSSTPIKDLSSSSTSGKSSSANAKSSSSSAKTLSSSGKTTSSSSSRHSGQDPESSSTQNKKSSSSKLSSSSSASGKSSSSNAKSSSSSNKAKSSTSMDSISSSSLQNDKSSSSKPASSSSTKAKTSSSSSKAVSSSSTKTSNGEIPDFYVKMIGPFEFEIVLDESVPSLTKKYAVMDMKGQVLSVGELNDKNAYVKVPTRGAYVVKLGLSYRRINIR
jgi:hypothetical protein